IFLSITGMRDCASRAKPSDWSTYGSRERCHRGQGDRVRIHSLHEVRSGEMLVLSRQRDESIIIGDNIVITVVDIRGDKVRLGIQARTEIPVHRQEVYEAIQRENMRAQGLDPDEAPVVSKFPNRRNSRPAT